MRGPRLSPPAPKPCPKCYEPMRRMARGWFCVKHGFPGRRQVTEGEQG